MGFSFLGVLFSLLAAVGLALNVVLARPGMRYTSFYLGTLVSLLVSFLLVGTVALVVDAAAFLRLTLSGLFWFALLGLLHFSLGRTFSFKAIQRLGVSRTALLIGATPLVAALLALLLFGEEISPLLGLGTLLVVAGVTMVLKEAR